MDFKISRNKNSLQNVLLIFLICINGEVQSRLSLSHSHNSPEKPENIFFYDIVPYKSTLTENKPENMTCRSVDIEQSCMVVQSYVKSLIRFQYQNMECDNCTFLELPIKEHKAEVVNFKLSAYGTMWQVLDKENKSICGLEKHYLDEGSWYHLYVNETGCSLETDRKSDNAYTPLLFAFGAYLLLAVICIIYKYISRTETFNRLFVRDSLEDLAAAYSSSTTIDEKKPNVTTQRLRSLDTVRGISIVVMIFVNYGAGRYQLIDHSVWNGLTIADLVFPWFIWMMGMSMALSMRSLMRKSVPRKKIFRKIVKRSIILFILGIMSNTICNVVDVQNLRILGVLQRFSISYLVVATVHLFYASADNKSSSSSKFRDLTPYGGEWLFMLTLLTLHFLLTFLVHAPECPRGYLGPGGLHDQSAYAECTGGAAGYIDRILLGPNHIYQNPGIKPIYHNSLPYDPEGILGYLTSIFLVFLGLQAGKILLTYKDSKDRLIRWLVWGLTMGLIAGILCKFSKNDGWIPVNKNLWSVSFIMATGGMAFILLSICYLVCDVQKWWSGAPFYQAGMNSIALYIGHEMTHQMFPFSFKVSSTTHFGYLFMNLWGTTAWVLIAMWMNYKNVFITI